MVVETNLHLGVGIVRGDQFALRRTIINIPSTATLSSAELTLAQDAGSSPIINKNITSVEVSGEGQIENIGSDQVGVIRFDLEDTDTEAMVANTEYLFDIRVVLSDGSILTIESGRTSAQESITP